MTAPTCHISLRLQLTGGIRQLRERRSPLAPVTYGGPEVVEPAFKLSARDGLLRAIDSRHVPCSPASWLRAIILLAIRILLPTLWKDRPARRRAHGLGVRDSSHASFRSIALSPSSPRRAAKTFNGNDSLSRRRARDRYDSAGHAGTSRASNRLRAQRAAGAAGARERSGRSDHLRLSDAGAPGLEFLALLRQEGDETPLIMLTRYGSIEHAVTAIKAGAIDYITKPVRPDSSSSW
jgi:CheY-like chemotaxis protein